MIKSSKSILLSVAATAIALLGVALYLQFVENMAPCPLCIMQRYAFTAIALFCLGAAFMRPRAQKVTAGLGGIAALTGAGIAIWHLWIKAHPAFSCGIDPMETALNKIFTAKLLPFLFQADGFCSTEYPPFFGASIPQWALAWFLVFAFVLGWFLRRPAPTRWG
jgi:disulfide bond formation protein DsbB